MSVAGRPLEQRAVADLLHQASSTSSCLLIEGDPGIGKTTLWLDAVQQARERGFRVLSTRTGAAEVSLTFAALADLFSGVDPAVLADLPPAQLLAIDRVLALTVAGPATDEQVVGAALVAVIQRLTASGPVLLAIDDVQWVDASSRAVLGFAVRRLVGRVGVLGTVRLDPAHPAATEWLQSSRAGDVARLRVSPLSLDGLHSLLSERLGRTLARTTLVRIAEISGGNPFYALELARVLDDESGPHVALPDSLAALVSARIGRLSSDVGDVLLIVAAAAAPTVELIAAACSLTVERVMPLLEDAETRGIIALDGNRISFTHPLLSIGVYSGASAPRRRAAHRALSVAAFEPELRARHLALAATEGDAAILAELDAAADAALIRGAPSAAAELIALAIRLGGDSHERLLRHAELLFRAGTVERARLRLEPLIDVMPPGPLRSKALSLLGAVRVYGNSFPEAVEMLTRAADDALGHPALHLLTLLRLAPSVGVAGDREKSIDYARRAVAHAEALGVDALRSQALAMWVTVSFLFGLGFDEQALRTALTLENPRGDEHLTYLASAVEAVTMSWRGRPDQARERFQLLRRRCEERGAEAAAIWVAEHAVMVDIWLGRFGDATLTATDAVTRAEQIGGHHVTVIAGGLRAAAAAYTGDVEHARRAARAAITDALASGGVHLAVGPRTTLGFVEVSVGDYPAALAAFAPMLATFDPRHGTEILIGGFLPDAVEALVALGRSREAEPLVTALEANGARLDRPWMRAVGARGRALLLAAHGDLVEAEKAAHRAIDEHDRLPMPFEAARTLLVLGQLQRRQRRKHAATETLRDALCIFERLGAPLWIQRTRTEMQRLHTAGGDGRLLTATERRVADRAAAGLSNKQIAAELFIAEKTVETNLSRVYRKLGIRSRAGLFAALTATNVRDGP